MQSSHILTLNTNEDKIRQLHREISYYITILDKSIKDGEDSYIVLQYKIDRWKDKKAVLEVALLCLSGGKNFTDLNSAIHDHSHWNEKDLWGRCKTEIFVKNVRTLLTQYSLTPSFLLLCLRNNFNLLPNDIQLFLLVCHLDRSADVIHFAMTSKNNYQFFRTNFAMIFLRPSLNHVALGEYDAAEQIYLKDKSILTKKGTTSDHPGRYCFVNQTPLQIAWRNEEYEEAEKMGSYLTPEERQKQFDEVFPDGELISYGCDLERAKLLLKDVYDAILIDDVINENNLDEMTDRTRNALQALHDAVNPENYNKCQKGLVFDVRIYLEALKRYDTNFNTFGNWDRRTFWCVKVVELIASCLSTGYLRPHCQGIGNIVDGRKLSGKGCVLADGSSYFNRDSKDLPGMHFFVGYYGRPFPCDHRWWHHRTGVWRNYVEQKQQAGRTYATILADRKLCNADFVR